MVNFIFTKLFLAPRLITLPISLSLSPTDGLRFHDAEPMLSDGGVEHADLSSPAIVTKYKFDIEIINSFVFFSLFLICVFYFLFKWFNSCVADCRGLRLEMLHYWVRLLGLCCLLKFWVFSIGVFHVILYLFSFVNFLEGFCVFYY